jgi:hypothetical protein
LNKAKILLIYPNQDSAPRIPTALAILSAKLIEKGYDVRIFDLSFIDDKFITDFDSDWSMYRKSSLNMPQLSEKRIIELVYILIEDFSKTHIPYKYQTPVQVLEMRKVS